MENKKQDVKSLMEFKKAVVEFGNRVNGLVYGLSKLLNDIEIPDEEEDTWKMKCPYKKGDEYYLVDAGGSSNNSSWDDWVYEKMAFNQGNIFKTKEAAELQAKRRNLLTRFRAFRDECNDGWKPDWNDINQDKYVIKLEEKKDFYIALFWTVNEFNLFGYFKNQKGAQRAIELFGDEIKELFVDCEGE